MMLAMKSADGGVEIVVLAPKSRFAGEDEASWRARVAPHLVEAVTITDEYLPRRDHRDAWVLRDGRVVVDPMRIKRAPAMPAQTVTDEPHTVIVREEFDSSPIREVLLELAREINTLKSAIAERDNKFERLVEVVSKGVKQAELRQ